MKKRTLTLTSLDLLDYFGSVLFELTGINIFRSHRKYIFEILFYFNLNYMCAHKYFELNTYETKLNADD